MFNRLSFNVLFSIAFLLLFTSIAPGQSLTVYQNLDEATARISRLSSRPALKLEGKGTDGNFQNETMIFHDVETGNEVWSLTNELCTDLANIERRCAWSSNGQYISFIGNKDFWNITNNQQWDRAWPGYSYIANADGSHRRALYGMVNGTPRIFNDKFNNWDQKAGNVLYYPADNGKTLYKLTINGNGDRDTVAQKIFTFPTSGAKIVQEMSDSNYMLIEESGSNPNCYVLNMNLSPTDPKFCMTYPLASAVHPGSFRFRRSDLIVTGGYESGGSITLKVDTAQGKLVPYTLPTDPYNQSMAHLWYGPPDDRVVYSGNPSGKPFGLYVTLPGQAPKLVARVNDGHPTWSGHDPNWFFYAVGTTDNTSMDPRYFRRLIAGSADGTQVKIICTPYDRLRGGTQGYDAIPRPNQSPDATKSWFHSSMLMPSDVYTGSYIAVFRKPYAPTDLSYSGGVLRWTPNTLSYEAKGYFVYKKNGANWDLITTTPVAGTSLATGPGQYMVTMQEWSGLESDTSSVVLDTASGAKTAAITGWDKAAPPKVTGLTVTPELDAEGQYRLRWNTDTATDLRYYNIYFSSLGNPAVSQQRLVVSPAADQTEYLDWTAPIDAPGYYWAITAIDRQGNESAPTYVTVPEPATLALLLAGAIGLLQARSRRNNR